MKQFIETKDNIIREGFKASETCIEAPSDHWFWSAIPEGKKIQENGEGELPTLIDIPQSDTDADNLLKEKEWVSVELVWCDKELAKHRSGHSRTTSTEVLINTYSNELRDYIQGGVITTSKPETPS